MIGRKYIKHNDNKKLCTQIASKGKYSAENVFFLGDWKIATKYIYMNGKQDRGKAIKMNASRKIATQMSWKQWTLRGVN